MKIKSMTSIDAALASEFHKGLAAGQMPTDKNTAAAAAIAAIVTRRTNAEKRAYWSGYLCQVQKASGGTIPE